MFHFQINRLALSSISVNWNWLRTWCSAKRSGSKSWLVGERLISNTHLLHTCSHHSTCCSDLGYGVCTRDVWGHSRTLKRDLETECLLCSDSCVINLNVDWSVFCRCTDQAGSQGDGHTARCRLRSRWRCRCSCSCCAACLRRVKIKTTVNNKVILLQQAAGVQIHDTITTLREMKVCLLSTCWQSHRRVLITNFYWLPHASTARHGTQETRGDWIIKERVNLFLHYSLYAISNRFCGELGIDCGGLS